MDIGEISTTASSVTIGEEVALGESVVIEEDDVEVIVDTGNRAEEIESSTGSAAEITAATSGGDMVPSQREDIDATAGELVENLVAVAEPMDFVVEDQMVPEAIYSAEDHIVFRLAQ